MRMSCRAHEHRLVVDASVLCISLHPATRDILPKEVHTIVDVAPRAALDDPTLHGPMHTNLGDRNTGEAGRTGSR